MLILKKIMNHFIQKEELNLNLKNFSFFYNDNSENKISHCKLYKTLLNSNEFIDQQENIDMLKVYLNSKKIINRLNYFVRKYRWKNAIKYDVNHDLYLNDLDDFPKHQKITLLENKTIYIFRLSDLVNCWVTGLTNNQGLFSRPLPLKNPHTNIEISYHNLINIYIKLLHSNFNIPLCIHAFYLSNMSTKEFSYKYFGILKEKTIENFIISGSSFEKYEQTLNLLHDYRKIIDYTTVINRIPYSVKIDLVINLKSILALYIRSKFSCNPLVKRDYTEITKMKLKEFYDKNKDLGINKKYITRYVPMAERSLSISPSPPPPPPESMRRRRPTVPPPLPPPHLPPIHEIDISSNNIARQPVIQPITEGVNEIIETSREVEESIQENISTDESIEEDINESDSSETIDLEYESDSIEEEYDIHINPFMPTREINRTPPNSLSRRRQQISSSFSLFR